MKGIERRVRDYKDVCHVFGCNVNVDENDRYNKGEYAIYTLPDLSKYDGIVYVKNTFQLCAKIRALILTGAKPVYIRFNQPIVASLA